MVSETNKLLRILIELMTSVSSKMDVQALNSQRVLTSLLPEEEIIVTPADLPALPLKDEESFNQFEDFLSNELAFTRMVSLHTFS